jgi:hypothetical protein
MTKMDPLHPIDARKELERFCDSIQDEDAAQELRKLIHVYAYQRELEVLEEAKEYLDGQEWMDVENISQSIVLDSKQDGPF